VNLGCDAIRICSADRRKLLMILPMKGRFEIGL